jgi:hypothetical protein
MNSTRRYRHSHRRIRNFGSCESSTSGRHPQSIHTHTHTLTHTHTTHAHARTHARTHTRTHARTHTNTHTDTTLLRSHYLCACVRVSVRVCVGACACTRASVGMSIQDYVRACVCARVQNHACSCGYVCARGYVRGVRRLLNETQRLKSALTMLQDERNASDVQQRWNRQHGAVQLLHETKWLACSPEPRVGCMHERTSAVSHVTTAAATSATSVNESTTPSAKIASPGTPNPPGSDGFTYSVSTPLPLRRSDAKTELASTMLQRLEENRLSATLIIPLRCCITVYYEVFSCRTPVPRSSCAKGSIHPLHSASAFRLHSNRTQPRRLLADHGPTSSWVDVGFNSVNTESP